MKFDHVVNYNGTYYAAGEEVPIEPKQEEFIGASEPVIEEVATEAADAPKKRGGRRPRKEV
jgi:hypothetical protein